MWMIPWTKAWYERKIRELEERLAKEKEEVHRRPTRKSYEKITRRLKRLKKELKNSVPKELYNQLSKDMELLKERYSSLSEAYNKLEREANELRAAYQNMLAQQKVYEEMIANMKTELFRSRELEELLQENEEEIKAVKTENEKLRNEVEVKDEELNKALNMFKLFVIKNIRSSSHKRYKAGATETLVIYHWDLDGTASAALVIESEKREGKKTNVIGASEHNWHYYLNEIARTKNLFILDLPFYRESLRFQPPATHTIFISDKQPEMQPEIPADIEMVCDENYPTSEIVYNYLLKKGKIKDREKARRIVELGKMSHGLWPDPEALNIMYALEINPKLSERIAYALAEDGGIKDGKLWNDIVDLADMATYIKEITEKKSKEIYRNNKCLILEFPTWSLCEGKILSKIRSIDRVNAFGIEYKKDNIRLYVRRVGDEEDLQTIFSHIRNNFEGYGTLHKNAGSIRFPKKYLNEVIELIKDYYK